ncbi:phosphoribosyltransferase [Clostridium sp. MT-14]|uniref:phosphoribosyltransferase n=1 Tax=Clostridium sp. MT-14 TaxID=3348360 RepID=UPI0035F46DED
MKHLTLSIKDVKRDCLELSKLIDKSGFRPDCVVYIKTGGYLVGKYIAEYYKIQLRGLRILREGNGIKSKFSFILRILPKFVKNLLRELEFKSGIHAKRSNRVVTEIDENLLYGENILLVDDSIDTGNTIVSALDFLKNNSNLDLNIKVLALNKFKLSEKLMKTDYYLYEDSIIIYPWSKDSKEYKDYIKEEGL